MYLSSNTLNNSIIQQSGWLFSKLDFNVTIPSYIMSTHRIKDGDTTS